MKVINDFSVKGKKYYSDLGFEKNQVLVLMESIYEGLSEEQIQVFADPNIPYGVMKLCMHGFMEGLTKEQIMEIKQYKEYSLAELAKKCFEEGLSKEQTKYCINFDYDKKHDVDTDRFNVNRLHDSMIKGFKKGLDVPKAVEDFKLHFKCSNDKDCNIYRLTMFIILLYKEYTIQESLFYASKRLTRKTLQDLYPFLSKQTSEKEHITDALNDVLK